MKVQLLFGVVGVLQLCTASKILVVEPMPARSHFILHEKLVAELLNRGHHVTFIAPFSMSKPHKNLTSIILTESREEFEKSGAFQLGPDGKFSMINMNALTTLMFFKMGETVMKVTLNNKEVRELIQSKQQFDLVLGECFLTEGVLAGFSHRFNAPLAGIATFMPNTWANEFIGNAAPMSYIPEPMLGFTDKMTFCERIINVAFSLLAQFTHYTFHLPLQEKLMRQYFQSDYPSLSKILSKTSLLLVNHHYSLAFPRPLVPNMIEIGGYHVRPPQPLPKDLQSFIDSSKDGVIFFSMGSNLESKDFLEETRNEILKAFSRLKQKVLWKFEDETIKDLPSNVKISKWLPQSDILAHPNVKLFITHGGLLSFIESIYRGVPMVGIPIFGDQPLNVKYMKRFGFGVELQYVDINEKTLYDAITEVLNNPKYKKNVKEKSKLLQDVPMSQMDSAMYWLEYVIRHKGALHLMSASQDLTWYQLYMLDIYAVVGGGILIVYLILHYSIKCIWKSCCKKKPQKVDKSKKRK